MTPASILMPLFFSCVALLAFVAILVKAGVIGAWRLLSLPAHLRLRRHVSARA